MLQHTQNYIRCVFVSLESLSYTPFIWLLWIHPCTLTLWRILYSFFCYFVSSAVCVCTQFLFFGFCPFWALHVLSHFISSSFPPFALTFMIVIWNWNAHKVFNNFEWSFFSAASNDIIFTNKRGFLFFTWRSIKLPKKGNAKKQHMDRETHTICDSFQLLFGFRSRPFWRADYYLLRVCVSACEFVLGILTIIWISIRKFPCICRLLVLKIKFPTLVRVLFFKRTKCSIYRQDFS